MPASGGLSFALRGVCDGADAGAGADCMQQSSPAPDSIASMQ
jgi:hypothetical protein